MNLLSPEACVCNSIRKAARAVTQVYEEALRPSGLRSTQFNILATLEGHGSANLAFLGKALVLDQTTLTRSLDLLEKQGLVERIAGATLRDRAMRLSKKGRQKFHQALPLWLGAQEKLLSRVGAEQWLALLPQLEAMTRVAQPSPTQRGHTKTS